MLLVPGPAAARVATSSGPDQLPSTVARELFRGHRPASAALDDEASVDADPAFSMSS